MPCSLPRREAGGPNHNQTPLSGQGEQPEARTMRPVAPPDSLHLQAAQGWLELGNHIEANEELENIVAG